MDVIHIEDLEIFANHGVFPEENVLGQKFVICADLYTDTWRAGTADDLAQSIHYGEVSHQIKKFLEERTCKLLETVVENLARELLLTVPRLHKVRLILKKPWAPVGLPLKTVSVEITRGWHTAYIALGSNLGDKKGYLDMAVKELDGLSGCQVMQVSSYVETEPYGGVEQDTFLNACLALRTLYEPEELLEALHGIEQKAKRERVIHWGPRTLDLDLLLYDDLVLDTPQLQIPHIEMHMREFVLRPLCEIAPWKRHPLLGKTVKQMQEEL